MSKADNVEITKTPVRAPRAITHCERVIGTRREVLDHHLVLGQAHTRQVPAEYQKHYNTHRPHRSRNQLPPRAQEQPPPVQACAAHRPLRTGVLGGVINDYRYAS
ncbi:transposase [Streptomyces sp. NBC_01003]|uniref:integrase core domain-containing protein n=1 Tax=Streptomyces sp. NBC_01003 TaxID=2903714 RepID=UPI003866268F|nr:transposase [Streptomyces sp. NBC_01003]